MANTARKQAAAVSDEVDRPLRVKKQKLPVLLVTGDEALWPQIGADLPPHLVLKQLDTVDELVTSMPSGQPGVVLWDARNHADPAAILSRLNLHSSRLAIVALDSAASAGAWTLPLQHRQVIAHVTLPIAGSALAKALEAATEEVNARMALLGDGSAAPADTSAAARKFPIVPAAIVGGVILAAAVGYALTRRAGEERPAATSPTTASKPDQAAGAPRPVESMDEKVDTLMERAQQAMTERHFIDPANGSALSLYRDVLIIDPKNGEARQGLQRLAEILIARVQSALDERKFDVALQFLETARSIDATDKRLAALDERIASLRSELGPAQIMAAISAQNFDRAAQLIDESARTKTLPAVKLAQLREELRKHRDEAEQVRLLKLADTRLQQDKLIEPRNDSAAYYIDQARQAGAPAATLQPQAQELQKRLVGLTRTAIEQRHYADADRLIAELHTMAAAPAVVAALQHDLSAVRTQSAPQKPEQPNYVELSQARLTQGKLVDPENDNALYYVNQLRAADPRNSALPQLIGAVQSQLLDRAKAVLDAGDSGKAESLLQAAASLGNSAEIDALNGKLRQAKLASGDIPQVTEQSLTRLNKLEISYPYRAMQAGVEGWVELGYTVKADGTIGNLRVLNSNPSTTFDTAALKAVGKLRYQPVVQDGKVTPVNTQVRVVFRVPK
jgi:TonB family protein